MVFYVTIADADSLKHVMMMYKYFLEMYGET